MDSCVRLPVSPSGVFGGVFLEVLSLCYNRMGTFLVAGFYLINYDRGFVILIVNFLGRLKCILLFVLCFSSLVVGLVLHHGCEYLLLGVDVVCHCFCSPCCDLCAAAWVTVLCTVFVGDVRWCPYCFYLCCPP